MRALRVEHDTLAALPTAEVGLAPNAVGADAPDAPEFPLALVVWRDAFFDFDRKPDDETRPDYLVHTVGFVLADGPTFVSLAQEVLPDDDGFRAVTHIPLAIVERLEYLASSVDASPMAD
ncbi:MAG TPA: hypothetical protein VLA82_07220 [Actinomycetota bacterium]|nr:hypothetical protein [Actinomycetota bacterium]